MATVAQLEGRIESLTARLEALEEINQRLYERSGLAEQDRQDERRKRFADFYTAQGLPHNEANSRAARDVRKGHSSDRVVANYEAEVQDKERRVKERQEQEEALRQEQAQTQRTTNIRHCAHCLRRMYNLGGFKDQAKLDAAGLKAYAETILMFPDDVITAGLEIATQGQVSIDDIKEFV